MGFRQSVAGIKGAGRDARVVVCARFLAVVGVDASVANTSHLVVALRVRQTVHSMKIGSADTALFVMFVNSRGPGVWSGSLCRANPLRKASCCREYS